MNTIFVIAAFMAFTCTVLAVTNRNAIHALLFLILSLLSVSVIFYILGAPFIAALEVIVYAGAIMVLFIFVVMMLNVNEREMQKQRLHFRSWILPVTIASILMVIFIFAVNELDKPNISRDTIGPKQVGISLFTTYLIGVEIAAILLLAGIVGAYHLGRQKRKVIHRFLKPKKENVKILTNADL